MRFLLTKLSHFFIFFLGLSVTAPDILDEILVLTEYHFNDFFLILIFYTHLFLYRVGYFLPTSIIRKALKIQDLLRLFN